MHLVRRALAILALSLLLAALPPGPQAAASDPSGVWPLQPQPTVVRSFDPPAVAWGSGHRGVDLLGHLGQQVRAAMAGTVSFAGTLAGRGVVVVNHGATRTTYEPVSASVEVGDRVAEGATLGQLAFFGSHCLPRTCLHWGWLRDETYLDPLRLVGGGPVRLLPLWRAHPVPAITLSGPYSLVLQRLAGLRQSPLAQARGCACW